MVTQLNFKAPSIELKRLDNLWFQLTGLICNLKCKHCYLSCSPNNKARSFLPLDKIRNALEEAKNLGIKEIYLNGGEPFLHPDLNNIIRMTLKLTNVTIITNGTLINDKKARFLRQIENDHDNELIFRISLDHYTEEKNDELRGKGSFKKTISGIENLIRYGFNPIISAVNVWNEDDESLKQGFFKLLTNINFDPEDINFKSIPPIKLGEFARNYQGYTENDLVTHMENNIQYNFDCTNSRVVTDNGIYACPALTSDPRGKVGNSLQDSSKKFFLETSPCFTCYSNNKGLFKNSWSV